MTARRGETGARFILRLGLSTRLHGFYARTVTERRPLRTLQEKCPGENIDPYNVIFCSQISRRMSRIID